MAEADIRSAGKPVMKKIVIHEIIKNDYEAREAYKALRTNFQFCGEDVHLLTITSCQENEGKTTVSLELAKSLAEINKKVLLIDADMRKSVMASQYVTQTGIEGLSQFLSGQSDLSDVLYATQYPNLYMIFSGRFPPNPVELINKQKFKDLLQNAKKSFDYVIIDTPPLGAVIDAAVIASYCDSAILVISANKVNARTARYVKNQLEKSGCRILGAVLKNIDSNKNSFYYKHYYKYYYSHYYGSLHSQYAQSNKTNVKK